MTELTKAQKAQLQKHAPHHSAKHMKTMRTNMRFGKSFKAAHLIAKKADSKK